MDQCLEHDVFHAYKLIVPTPVTGCSNRRILVRRRDYSTANVYGQPIDGRAFALPSSVECCRAARLRYAGHFSE